MDANSGEPWSKMDIVDPDALSRFRGHVREISELPMPGRG
jgi:hypothetical protein